MNRSALLSWLTVTALLSGCTTVSQTPAFTGPAREHEISPDQTYCQTVAQQRTDDALANGYGLAVQEKVYLEAYRVCLSWLTRRPK